MGWQHSLVVGQASLQWSRTAAWSGCIQGRPHPLSEIRYQNQLASRRGTERGRLEAREDERIGQSQVTVLITKGTAGLLADPPRPRDSSVSSPEPGRPMLPLVFLPVILCSLCVHIQVGGALPGPVMFRRRIRTAARREAGGMSSGERRDRDAVQGLDRGAG
jgi:hypothetical protein